MLRLSPGTTEHPGVCTEGQSVDLEGRRWSFCRCQKFCRSQKSTWMAGLGLAQSADLFICFNHHFLSADYWPILIRIIILLNLLLPFPLSTCSFLTNIKSCRLGAQKAQSPQDWGPILYPPWFKSILMPPHLNLLTFLSSWLPHCKGHYVDLILNLLLPLYSLAQ